jgi:hypothetical protein
MTLEQIMEVFKVFGPTGLCMVGLLVALRYKDNQATDSQERRISDAQAALKPYLELREKEQEQREKMIAALEANADAVRDLRSLVEHILAERGYNRMPIKR